MQLAEFQLKQPNLSYSGDSRGVLGGHRPPCTG